MVKRCHARVAVTNARVMVSISAPPAFPCGGSGEPTVGADRISDTLCYVDHLIQSSEPAREAHTIARLQRGN